MDYTNINGKIVPTAGAAVQADNGAFRYGYGLFETMLVQHDTIALWHYHRERLFAGALQLHFDMPALMTASWLEAEVLRLVRKNKASARCRVRLQLYAGGGGLYGTDAKHPQFIIECFPLEPEFADLNENGLVVGIAAGINKSEDTLSSLKSCNALVYAMGARQAKEMKWNDALICNTKGHVIESTLANIFIVKDGEIATPPLSEGCVAGVMRRHILSTIPGIKEIPLTTEDLMQADEVFLTNAIKKIKWVGRIGDKVYGHEVARRLSGML